MSYYIGVDVGSGSVRAVLVDGNGNFKAKASKNITIWNPKTDYYQQSSCNIWKATCEVVKDVVQQAKVTAEKVRGLGFDATCSLVVVDKNLQPLSVGTSDDEQLQNIIMWMDHRAMAEAEHITKLGHSVLSQYGGTLSVENNISKILWLKNNMKADWWDSVGHLFDLPDFMTSKATGNYSTRSLCSLVCKMGYLSDDKTGHRWDKSFWDELNLADILNINDQNNKLGTTIQTPGQSINGGLCNDAAKDLGLIAGTSVATSLVDAHSGALALWGCKASNIEKIPLTSRLAMICGTSTCHMGIGDTAIHHNGIWGPFYSIIVPKLWVQEAGQSIAGKLLDHIIDSHPATKSLSTNLPKERSLVDELYTILVRLQEDRGLSSMAHLTCELHIWPDFHGNRSPLADPSLKGMICGLTLDESVENLALLYLATIQALAYGTKLILNEMRLNGPPVEVILMCGGLSRNTLYVQVHADVTGVAVVVPKEEDSVALGAAILGASASNDFQNLTEAMKSMGGEGDIVYPRINDYSFHKAKYQVFMKMLSHQNEYQEIMKDY